MPDFSRRFGKRVVVSGEYIWKYTHNAFDFSVLGNTPITFPIDWHNSKIPGYALNVEVPKYHDFSAYLVASSVAARFYPPQVAGAGATVGATGLPFRIDHDEKFNQTTHVQYTIPARQVAERNLGRVQLALPTAGLVAGSTPCYSPTDPNTPARTLQSRCRVMPGVAMVDNNILPTTNPVTCSRLYPLTLDQEFQGGFACNGVTANVNILRPTLQLARLTS